MSINQLTDFMRSGEQIAAVTVRGLLEQHEPPTAVMIDYLRVHAPVQLVEGLVGVALLDEGVPPWWTRRPPAAMATVVAMAADKLTGGADRGLDLADLAPDGVALGLHRHENGRELTILATRSDGSERALWLTFERGRGPGWTAELQGRELLGRGQDGASRQVGRLVAWAIGDDADPWP